MTVKSDSNLPDSKSDPLPITFCFLGSPYTHLACQDAAGSSEVARAQALEPNGEGRMSAIRLPSSVAMHESLSFCVSFFLISEVGINCAYTSYGVDLIAPFTNEAVLHT